MMSSVLAVQNMEATGSVPKDQELEFKALTGSLSMMSKVLNDVLDLWVAPCAGTWQRLMAALSNRMDSGRFESVARPFAFHQVMKSMFVPLQMATNARELEL
jgi:osomolarity two-component system sensor histidine kinase SLN1